MHIYSPIPQRRSSLDIAPAKYAQNMKAFSQDHIQLSDLATVVADTPFTVAIESTPLMGRI